jgi:predicted component of type VI protein secretion system
VGEHARPAVSAGRRRAGLNRCSEVRSVDVTLVMVKADGSSKEVPMPVEGVVIGRDPAAKLRIPLPSVSRKHCELKIDDDELVVTDLGSSNGTFVNGRRVKTTELAPGDLLAVGPIVFVVRIDGHPKQIDAKDSYAAGAVVEDNDDSDADVPSPTGPKTSSGISAGPPTTPAGPAPGKDIQPPPPKSLLDDDDDISALLKNLGDDDDDK